jgi:hypothetical protein
VVLFFCLVCLSVSFGNEKDRVGRGICFGIVYDFCLHDMGCGCLIGTKSIEGGQNGRVCYCFRVIDSQAAFFFIYPYKFACYVYIYGNRVFDCVFNALGDSFDSFVRGCMKVPFVFWGFHNNIVNNIDFCF